MSVLTLRLRHTGNWVSIPYAQIPEIEWRDGEWDRPNAEDYAQA